MPAKLVNYYRADYLRAVASAGENTELEVYFGLFESRLFQFRDQKVDLRRRQHRVIATAEHEGLAVPAV
jgi:hypothetical protein